jgi:hypothetical protein
LFALGRTRDWLKVYRLELVILPLHYRCNTGGRQDVQGLLDCRNSSSLSHSARRDHAASPDVSGLLLVESPHGSVVTEVDVHGNSVDFPGVEV